jgi:hypothetical protein
MLGKRLCICRGMCKYLNILHSTSKAVSNLPVCAHTSFSELSYVLFFKRSISMMLKCGYVSFTLPPKFSADALLGLGETQPLSKGTFNFQHKF